MKTFVLVDEQMSNEDIWTYLRTAYKTHHMFKICKYCNEAGGYECQADSQIDDGSIDMTHEPTQQIKKRPTQTAQQRQKNAVEVPVGVKIVRARHEFRPL